MFTKKLAIPTSFQNEIKWSLVGKQLNDLDVFSLSIITFSWGFVISY